MKIYHIFLSCDEDLLINNTCIEKFLNGRLSNGRDLGFKSIKKHNNLETSKEDLDDLKKSSFLVINTHKDMDNITYWELGYAMGKGLTVIGYWDGKSSIKISPDVKDLIRPIPSDTRRFVEKVNRAIKDLEPAKYALEEDWHKQKEGARKDAQKELEA